MKGACGYCGLLRLRMASHQIERYIKGGGEKLISDFYATFEKELKKAKRAAEKF
jgi:hypothetical protein